MRGTRDLLPAFDMDVIEPEALLFQTGYLTIRDEDDLGGEPLYRLGYPNHEVRQSFNRLLLRALAPVAHEERHRPLRGLLCQRSLLPLRLGGLDGAVEDSSSLGRVAMAVRFNNHVYLFELKAAETTPTGGAMAQLKAKGYADKCRHLGLPIHLVGVKFSRETRNLVAFAVEDA